MVTKTLSFLFVAGALCQASLANAAPDPGRKACIVDARRLCSAAMNSMSRKKVEACMIAHIDQTSPTCHDTMLRMRAERAGAGAR